VGITALTPLAPRAYKIATEFRKRGVCVVMGGFHATWLSEEASRYVDSTDWRLYDMAHAVFRPKNMEPEELEEKFLEANRKFYSVASMLKRLPALRRSIIVFGPTNWGFRQAWRNFKIK
jgi:hypothetical protein